MAQVLPDDASRFRLAWIEAAFAAAARENVTLVDGFDAPGRVFSGVDLGVGLDPRRHDETAIFTVLLRDDGRRQVLSIESGRWTGPEIIQRIKSTHLRFGSTIRVETNGAQGHVLQHLQQENVRVQAHATGKNKHDPVFGIESVGIELEAGRWVVPDAPATRAWARELLNYSPSAHPGDRVIAGWLALAAVRTAPRRELLPVPFIRSNAPLPLLGGVRDVVVARPGDFPEDAWADVSPWMR
jgi:hypothetical protein